jgi:hypothetical protein
MEIVPGVSVMEFAYTVRATSERCVLGTRITRGLMPFDGTRMRSATSTLDFATCHASHGT